MRILELAKRWGGALVIVLSMAAALPSQAGDYNIGIQTWTLRNLTFDQMVEFCVKHKLNHLQVIANHLSPTAPEAELKRKKAILDRHGLKVYTFGVAGTSMDKEQNRKLFEFAKMM